jgi:GxxExxY protein
MSLVHDSALSNRVIGLAIEVHRQLGPGLLESVYETCLCYELKESGLAYDRQTPLPITYKTIKLDAGFRMDVVVNEELVVEVKSVDRLMAIHEAQMMTYLRLSSKRVGLLMNFNTVVLKDGLKRIVM